MFLKVLSLGHRTVGFRLAALYTLVFVTSFVALFVFGYLYLSSFLHRVDRELVESEAKLFASIYRNDGLKALIEEVGENHEDYVYVRVADTGDKTLFQSMPAEWDDFSLKELESEGFNGEQEWASLVGEDEGEWFDDLDVLEIKSARLPDGALLQVGRSSDSRGEILELLRGVFSLVMIGVLIVGIAGGTFLANRSLRPVRALARTMRSVKETGRLSARVPIRGTGDELDQLANQYNALQDTIESLIGRMRNALDNIAHDLRTPLTRMRVSAEVALRSYPDEKSYRQALAECVEESEQTLAMLNILMDIAEAEAGAMKLDLEQADLPALTQGVVGLYETIAEDKEITIHTAVPEQLYLRVDRKRVRQAVANLLDNALKYTPHGGRVGIEAYPQDRQVVITVEDTGIGIRSDEISRIWDRLYRGETSRTERGLGLGLSLVRAVALAHKGSVDVDSTPGKGSRFAIYLPADYVN